MNNQALESIDIKYFRSFKDVHIDFHPGVNCITGANDQGKSNILRAINLVVQNQPNSADYIFDPLLLGLKPPKKHGGDLDIQLTIGGRTISRFRNAVWNKKEERFKAGTENLYILSGEKEPFRSFGRGKVPDIIKQHLNMSAINIAYQLDGPFLLGKSPPDVARYYNSLVNLDVIDSTISNIASTLRKEKADLKVEEALVEKKTEGLKDFDWLFNAEKDLIKVEKINNYLKHLNSDWSELCEWIENLKKLEIQDQELSEITKYKDTVDRLGAKSIEITVLNARWVELTKSIDSLKSLIEEDKKLKEIIKHKDKVDSLIKQANEIDENIAKENELQGYIEKLEKYQKDEKQYKSIVKYRDKAIKLLALDVQIERSLSDYNLLQEFIERRLKLDLEQNSLKDKIERLKTEFAELMPETCPFFDLPCDHIKEENNG